MCFIYCNMDNFSMLYNRVSGPSYVLFLIHDYIRISITINVIDGTIKYGTIKYHNRNQLLRKRFISSCRFTLQSTIKGNQTRNLKSGQESGGRNQNSSHGRIILPGFLPLFVQAAFLHIPGPPAQKWHHL